jgi:hypothetical protein
MWPAYDRSEAAPQIKLSHYPPWRGVAYRAIMGSVSDENQARYAQRLGTALNEGVLQDAVEAGLEEQGQFTVDVLSVLDALVSAGVKLVRDDRGDVTIAYTTLLGIDRDLDGHDTAAGE